MTRPRGPTWHNRHAQPRAATEPPTASVSIEWDDVTGEIDTRELPPAVASALREERRARHRLRDVVAAHGDRVREWGERLDATALATADAKACAQGAALTKRLIRVLVAVAVLVPGAGLAAGKAFLDARDASTSSAASAVVERARVREDIDTLRAEVSALLHLFAPARPAGGPP